MASIHLSKVIQQEKLENLTPDIDISGIKITQPDVNRPGILLTGYFDHNDPNRIQVIGFVEYSYMQQMPQERKEEIYDKFLGMGAPCMVFCRELHPDETFLKYAHKYQCPVLMTKKATSAFMAEVIRWLNVRLAPMITIHGVLVDVYGEGVLITGESGIGKSEAALELIKRGHRLVSDDVVEIRRVSEETLIGSAPDITMSRVSVTRRPLTLSSSSKSGTKTKSTTASALRRNTRNTLATVLSATGSRSVPAEISRSSASRRLLTTVRRRWDTMRRRSFTTACRSH